MSSGCKASEAAAASRDGLSLLPPYLGVSPPVLINLWISGGERLRGSLLRCLPDQRPSPTFMSAVRHTSPAALDIAINHLRCAQV